MGTPVVTKATPSPPRSGVESLLGQLKISAFTFTFSTSYATGGEVFDPKASNPNEIGTVIGVLVLDPGSGHKFGWDAVNKKIKAYWSGTASAVMNEVAAATNLSVTPGALTVIVFHR